MQLSDVTLGERATGLCAQLGISVNDAKNARCQATSTYEARDYLVVIGPLPDGRSLRMMCQHGRTGHIVTLRPVPTR